MQSLLSGLLALIIVFSGGLGSLLDMVVPPLVDFTHTHLGEQTANHLPPDTDGYFAINLRPGFSQLQQMDAVLDNWADNPGIQAQLEELMSELESDTGISIDFEADVFPWLGPEVAMGTAADPEP